MDCKYVEEILVDYIEDFLDPDQRKQVDTHLAICSGCSRKIVDYRSIKHGFKSEVLPELSSEVIQRLEIEAQKQSNNTSTFWKKWFYSPVLIPVLSAAIALMVWIDYSDNQNNNPDDFNIYSTQVMAKKVNRGISLESSETTEEESDNTSDDIANGFVMADKPTSNNEPGDVKYQGHNDYRHKSPEESTKPEKEDLPSVGHISGMESKLINRESDTEATLTEQDSLQSKGKYDVQPGRQADRDSTDDVSGLELSKHAAIDKSDNNGSENLKIKENQYRIPEVINPESKSNGISKEDFKNTDESRLKKPEPPQLIIDKKYLDELNAAIKQQQNGNCDVAIKMNEGLLQKSPEPSVSIKAQIYMSLAECYEQQNKYSKAIENYDLLRQLAPSKSIFAEKKIDELRIKITNTGDTKPPD